MSSFGVLAFCIAMGFAAAATVASFYQWVTAERANFSVERSGPLGIVTSVLLCMFGGPFIVVQRVIAGLRSRELNALPALFGVVVAGMWSACAGVFYLSLLIHA